MCVIVREVPDRVEQFTPGRVQPPADQRRNGLLQSIDTRIGVEPGIRQAVRIESADRGPDVIQFEQP
jgi:hypothetical protein